MEIKNVKEPKNKEELQKKIKSMKNKLLFGKFIICFLEPALLAVLGISIQDMDKNNVFAAIFALGVIQNGRRTRGYRRIY